jgi:nitroimidazol reductase NimA-like FMN-containing flavoprotein (pyridoxamine 5'-phosphate oxidase superfamily)
MRVMDTRAAPSDKTRVRRHPERGDYDRETVDAILDEALICHVAWVGEDGGPRVIPTIHARDGDTLYIHGSQASRTLRALRGDLPLCLEATLIDGLVLARSTFNHSMNYRSVVVYATAREVTDPDEMARAQEILVEHVVRGRAAEARPPNAQELKQTAILALRLDEASAKVRVGGPKDPEEDLDLDVWAGVLPLGLAVGEPIPDAYLKPGVDLPGYVSAYRRPGEGGFTA